MMTRKDYIATANILKEFSVEMLSDAHRDLVDAFADLMQADNPRFDRTRFLDASGVNPL